MVSQDIVSYPIAQLVKVPSYRSKVHGFEPLRILFHLPMYLYVGVEQGGKITLWPLGHNVVLPPCFIPPILPLIFSPSNSPPFQNLLEIKREL